MVIALNFTLSWFRWSALDGRVWAREDPPLATPKGKKLRPMTGAEWDTTNQPDLMDRVVCASWKRAEVQARKRKFRLPLRPRRGSRPVPPVAGVRPSTWRLADVADLASGAYDARALPLGRIEAARLGVLSDALEEAGAPTCGFSVTCAVWARTSEAGGCWTYASAWADQDARPGLR